MARSLISRQLNIIVAFRQSTFICTPTVAAWIPHYLWFYLYMSFHHWMGIWSVTARKCKRTENQKTKTYFVCTYFTSLKVLLLCCQLGQVWSLNTICMIKQAKRIYRWETFIFSTVQPETGQEKRDKITGTIWAALLFCFLFCCCVSCGISLGVCPTLFNLTTKAVTGTQTKYKTEHNQKIIGQEI